MKYFKKRWRWNKKESNTFQTINNNENIPNKIRNLKAQLKSKKGNYSSNKKMYNKNYNK